MNALELSRRLLDDPALAPELQSLDPLAIDGQDARVAFWLNIYNARLRHELADHPREGSLLRHRGLFKRSDYAVGDRRYSLDVIEHGVLRRNARPPYAPRRLLKRSDPRGLVAPPALDPRIHFALNCGARSCPIVRPYDAEGLEGQLDAATAAYFAQEAQIDRDKGTATLPGLCKLYKADFGDRDALVRFAEAQLGERLDGLKINFADFDWALIGAPAQAQPRTPSQT